MCQHRPFRWLHTLAAIVHACLHIVSAVHAFDAHTWRNFGLHQSEALRARYKELDSGYRCLKPLPPGVRFHMVVSFRSRNAYFSMPQLRRMGLTGVDVFTYLRAAPDDMSTMELQLPCDMKHHERLLLPNFADEGAALATHIASFYDNLPEHIALVHDFKFTSWHSECGIMLRRLQAYHMGLQPGAHKVLRQFASTHRTLNGAHHFNNGDCCAPLLARIDSPEGDDPTCPWQFVGRAGGSDKAPGLCRLRGNNSPAQNWTVLSKDVPFFFIEKDKLLTRYEQMPQIYRVPITWDRKKSRDADRPHLIGGRKLNIAQEQLQGEPTELASSEESTREPTSREDSTREPMSRDHFFHQMAAQLAADNQAKAEESNMDPASRDLRERMAARQALRELPRMFTVTNHGVIRPSAAFDQARSIETAAQARLVHVQHTRPEKRGRPRAAARLTNVYDSLFPWVQKDMPAFPGWGLRKMWTWLLEYHKLSGVALRAPKPNERRKHFCCLQLVMPTTTMKTVPKAFFEDLAWFLNNHAWTPKDSFKGIPGRVTEYFFLEPLGLQYTTLEDLTPYTLVDQLLGSEYAFRRCNNDL